jgi:hypothetical protein
VYARPTVKVEGESRGEELLRLEVRRTLWGGLAGLAAMAICASPAAATSVQNQAGQPYTGTLNGVLSGSAVFSGGPFRNVICTQSAPSGSVTNSGTTNASGIARITTIDFESPGGEGCSTDIALLAHLDNQAQNLPWENATIVWVSDNASGTPNATFTLSNVVIKVIFLDMGNNTQTCDYAGNLGGTFMGDKQVQGDFFNPNNTASGNTELRFVSEPLMLTNVNVNCDSTVTLTAKYFITGQGGTKLQFHQSPPPVGGGSSGGTAGPAAGPTGLRAAALKRCKKKRSARARRNCKKRADLLPL